MTCKAINLLAIHRLKKSHVTNVIVYLPYQNDSVCKIIEEVISETHMHLLTCPTYYATSNRTLDELTFPIIFTFYRK